MSQPSYTCIEQLDLAAKQLEERNPSYGRFALILIDNVVELMIHRICMQEISHDNLWVKLGKPKFTAEQRADAIGQRFDRKVKLCKKIKKINDYHASAILICHKYRNELYHEGLKYNDIVWDISSYYLSVAIDMLGTVYPSNSWSSGEIVSRVVEKHAGKGGRKVLSQMKDVAKSLKKEQPVRDKTLQISLSDSAMARVKETEDAMAFLVEDDPQQRTEEETIVSLQFYDYIRSEEPLIKEIWSKAKSFRQQEAAMAFVKEIWKPRYKNNPLHIFKKQADNIKIFDTELKALLEFERFRSEFAYFSGLITEAAIVLDGYIQNQIDIMRGK